MPHKTKAAQNLKEAALEYHRLPRPGKLEISATKTLSNQRDLALAYSPGVAFACEEIVRDPAEAFNMTSRGNLVGVVTNGTAVLGLGAIGPLAAKPVMEGKAVLFKKFAGIDCFDIEINELDPDKLVDIIASLEPTFGGINLEDIKAPECFYVERKLRERMKIPVFHDDQHGTAIIVGAGILNGLRVVGKKPEDVKVVTSGAGAAALACLDMLVAIGIKRENIWASDIKGVVYQGRVEEMDDNKARYAQKTDLRTVDQLLDGADVFLGLSAARVIKPEWLAKMAQSPLIFALANPEPEIMPDLAKAARPDAIIATGRTDYPNQINNVLCFPFIFRGALDVGATVVNEAMKLAAVKAIADLAMAEQNDQVAAAYGDSGTLSFGPEYLIPKPFDPRLIVRIAPAVAKAAMDSGVAQRPIKDFDAYKQQLAQFVYHSGAVMKPIFSAAKKSPKRVVFAEGEEERVMRAIQVVIDEGIAHPIVIARPAVFAQRVEKFGLRMTVGVDVELVNPEQDARYRDYWQTYHQLTQRKGVTEQLAKIEMRRRLTLIGTMMVRKGDADAMICGTFGTHDLHLHYIDQVLGMRKDAHEYAAMNGIMLPNRLVFLVDTHVNYDPTAEQLAEITIMAAEELRRFGIEPKVALLSHSNFGTSNHPSAVKMRDTLAILRSKAPTMEVDGEMHGDSALDEESRRGIGSTLTGSANLLVCPNIDAANIAYNLLKTGAGNNVAIGPILLGCAKPVHILTPSATVRRIVNMAALAVVDANNVRQSPLL
ncbi:MAG: NADP-dependent malic enzyme [Betaproteobacteria bacterium]|nr:MAG: NADP-dependent malic enzyme [Betaproteobacteria bacterium]